ncbi:hypothetical protein R3P38DRAFT_3443905 [Favolaschia claudopus]|uniref:Uncharacterized protein n=1 Tax=Favolaschia claudopus TaxID=2862362 RepID=A0AAV9ZQ76_9AGAR
MSSIGRRAPKKLVGRCSTTPSFEASRQPPSRGRWRVSFLAPNNRFNLLQNFTGDNENQTEELAAAGGRNDSATGQAPNENRREGGDSAASRSEVNRNGNRPSSGTSPWRTDETQLQTQRACWGVPSQALVRYKIRTGPMQIGTNPPRREAPQTPTLNNARVRGEHKAHPLEAARYRTTGTATRTGIMETAHSYNQCVQHKPTQHNRGNNRIRTDVMTLHRHFHRDL